MEATTNAPVQRQHAAKAPYSPSPHDRVMRLVQRAPLPYWLTYLLLFTLEVLIHHIVDWVDGSAPAFHFRLIACLYPLLIWGPLAIMTYLDGTARQALTTFSPLLDVHSKTMQRLEYEFTTMPPIGVLIRGVFFTVLYVIFTVRVALPWIEPYVHDTTPTVVMSVVEGFFAFNNGLFYHTLRQLRLVNRTVKLVKQFDLFRLDAVYAFSHLTARTGVAWLLLASLVYVITPLQFSPVAVLGFLGMGIISALAAFVLPLWVVHQRLAAEKRGLIAAHDLRVKSTLAKLHHALDEVGSEDISQLNSALDGLSVESGILEKIRTWPWSNETLTGFLSAIVLPMVIFAAQLAIQKWLNL